MAHLILTDVNDNTYNFPDGFSIKDGGFSVNKNITNTFYAAGGRNIADGFLKSRMITIGGYLQGDTIEIYETKKRALLQAILKGGRLSRSGDSVDRYIDVKYADVTESSYLGNGDVQLQEFSIIFEAEYPFWQDETETEDSNILAGDDTFTVDSGDTDFIINPVIEIEADQSADVPSVQLTNKSDGAAKLIYADAQFVQGDIVSIDCSTGDVTRNGGATIDKFTESFLRLQPGVNTIEYEGAACTVTFKFRKVYL